MSLVRRLLTGGTAAVLGMLVLVPVAGADPCTAEQGNIYLFSRIGAFIPENPVTPAVKTIA